MCLFPRRTRVDLRASLLTMQVYYNSWCSASSSFTDLLRLRGSLHYRPSRGSLDTRTNKANKANKPTTPTQQAKRTKQTTHTKQRTQRKQTKQMKQAKQTKQTQQTKQTLQTKHIKAKRSKRSKPLPRPRPPGGPCSSRGLSSSLTNLAMYFVFILTPFGSHKPGGVLACIVISNICTPIYT